MPSDRPLHLDSTGTLTHRIFLDDPHLARLLEVLNQAGNEARVVGGAVRNALIGLPPGDIDVATTATPDVVMRFSKGAKFRTVPTGLAHGTVTVVVSGWPFEVTTLREDVATDGRHAVVEFGRDFARDALRRDFTINALSVGADGRVYDYADGLTDLAAGRVRFIGDAATRIREDYLRILRFFRFSASYADGPLDPLGLAAAIKHADGLLNLSRERIRAEMLKLLVAPRAADVVATMAASDLLDAIIRVDCCPERFARFRQILAERDARPDAILGLAALAIRNDGDPQRLRDALRLSNEERNRLERLGTRITTSSGSTVPPDANDLAALLFAEGRQSAADIVTLWHVDSGAPPTDPQWRAAARFVAIAQVPSLPVSGADVMARGVRSGPLVGEVLKTLQALWIRSGFPDSPTVLHRLLDESIEASRGHPKQS